MPLAVSAQTAPWDIGAVQTRLVELGYDVGETDGLLGPKTRDALRAFQADRGLAVNGLPDGATQRALFAEEPTQSEPTAEPATAAPEPATVPSPTPSGDDPPRLDAVPLGLVQVVPLAPTIAVAPHEGLPVVRGPVKNAVEESPPAEPAGVAAAAQGGWLTGLGSWDTVLKWAVLALGVLVAVTVTTLAALKRSRQRPAARPATAKREAHVFGIDVPPSRD